MVDVTQELKPCEYCGGKSQLVNDGDPKWPWVAIFDHEKRCPLLGYGYATEAEAIAAWNTRPAPDGEPNWWFYSDRRTGEFFLQSNRARMDPRYWTETALYEGPPQDVVTLVIAAREAWEASGSSGDDLDRALAAFAERVPYDDDPDAATGCADDALPGSSEDWRAALKQGEPR